MKKIRLQIYIIFLLVSLQVIAQPVETEYVTAELISEVQTIKPGEPIWLALRLEMIPDWHIYWRNAGDAGMTTRINWELPEGFSAGDIHWPYPEKIILEGLGNFGYEGEIILPVKIETPQTIDSQNKITIKAHAEWLVCKVECYPGEADISITLPVSQENPLPNIEWTELFAETRFNLPLKSSIWEFDAVKTDSSAVLSIYPPKEFNYDPGNVEFFPYENGIFKNAAPQIFSRYDEYYSLEIMLEDFLVAEPTLLNGILISELGWRSENSERAVEINVPFDESKPTENNQESSGFLFAIIFAFLGGIILNLMPCVLPVLSIKILGFVNYAGEEKSKIFKSGLTFGAGVLASFWILAGTLILLRAGGEELGWGFQLQSPLFILILSIFLFLFGLSLFGVFEIGTSLTALDGKVNRKNSYWDSFISGVMATVVATPCTAPFMGSALGYAIAQPAIINLAIFSSLGLGMASPYILLSAFPKWLKFIPKPGQWMETLKQFMGFLLIGTVIWLAWVLGIQAGSDSVVVLLIALLVASIGAWIYGRWGGIYQSAVKRTAAKILFILLIASGLLFGWDTIEEVQPRNNTSHSLNGLEWQPYSEKLFAELKNSGEPFFIDFTAAWCLSCQVNKKVALNNTEVVNKFNEFGITAVKADWTSRDEMITKALAAYGRNSVPLYVLYDGKSSNPEFLPEILTPGIVIDKLDEKFND